MWAPGGPGPAGWDRGRVGARLRAALAGLHELQGLRAAQQARVRGALAMQPAGSRGPGGQELRLEAALAALQEQLSRLRRQDAGLKTPLDRLDQQLSELQLGVHRPPAEVPEVPDSDSRPSSGFYELSDAGSCSLSTSCASVCSDRLSPSLGSLLPAVSMARPSMGDWRPRSADETTVPVWRPQPVQESGRLLASVEDTGQPLGVFRPRPVSTGDLERILPVAAGLQREDQEAAPPSLWQGTGVPSPKLDPKYQRDLVSRGGREVYLYPSPLHAVALQSPLFALTKETPRLDGRLPPRSPLLGRGDVSATPAGPGLEAGPAGAYIDRLLRLRSRETPSGDPGREQGPPGREVPPSPQKPAAPRLGSGGRPERLLCAPGRGALGGAAQGRAAGGDSLGQQAPAPLLHTQSPRGPPEKGPEPWNCRTYGEASVGPAPGPQVQQSLGDCSPGGSSSSGSVDCGSPPRTPGHPVRPPCTTSEASRMGLQTGHPKTKPVKVRRKASDKMPRLGNQALLLPERPWGVHAAPQLSPEGGPAHRSPEGGLRRRSVLAGGAPGRSCSESTLYPVPFFVPLLVAQHESYRAPCQALPSLETAPPCAAARRKQRRWQSTVEISAEAHLASAQEPSLGPVRSPARRAGGPQAQGRPTLARQDACARSQSDPAEQAAECASLLQSTVAESSEEAASDHTANRFGDGESSSSDSEGCFQSHSHRLGAEVTAARRGELAWPRAAPQQSPRAPVGARPPLPPVPKLCRIKASRALKKKIRRFQPTALKVMTMV